MRYAAFLRGVNLVKLRPFLDKNPEFLHYVSFLRAPTPTALPPARAHEILPHTGLERRRDVLTQQANRRDCLWARTSGLEVFSRIPRTAPNATTPNGWLEAKLKVPVTTRYWNVVQDIYKLIQAQPALEAKSVNHKL